MSNFKKFNRLELLVIKRVLEKINDSDYAGITCEDRILQDIPTQRLLTSSKRDLTYSQLDTHTLVYLITCDKARMEIRIYSLFALFHKLNNSDEYPFSFLISKEEYIKEALIPEIKDVLLTIAKGIETEIKKGEINEEINKGIRGTTLSTIITQNKNESQEYRGSSRNDDKESQYPIKPNIFNW